MRTADLPFIPPEASTSAPAMDLLFWVLTLVTVFFTVGIFVFIIYFSVKYRRGAKVDRSQAPLYHMPVEIAWTVIPLLIALGIFCWSTLVYLEFKHVPAGATEIYVTGKQWMWKIQHPEGRWENDELHIPVGRPIVLTMTSEDVIHDFFVPALRVKQDVIPGQYTQLSFTATKVGQYHLFCAQFCGTFHSTMTGTVWVMDPADYEQWLNSGVQSGDTPAVRGQRLFIQHGCDGCHGPSASVRAPRLDGIFGKPVAVQIPQPGAPLAQTPATTVIADTRYIHDSILLPEKEVAAGYKPIMPSFKNQVTEAEIFDIVAFIRSLGTRPPTNPSGLYHGPTRTLTPEEYRARVGFPPSNIKDITAGTVTTQGGAPKTANPGLSTTPNSDNLNPAGTPGSNRIREGVTQ